MGNIIIEKNGKENGKTAFLASKKFAGTRITFASIIFEDGEWVVRRHNSGRIDHFEKLFEARDEVLKGG